MLRSRVSVLAGVLAVGILVSACGSKATPAAQGQAPVKEPYKVGITGAISGGSAATYAPIAEGLRIYVESLNAKGGVDGHQIQLSVRDNTGDPTKTVNDLKFFAGEKVHAVAFTAPSGTISAYTAEMQAQKLPTLYMGPCYPPAPPPKVDPYFFCAGVSPITDAHALVESIFDLMGSEKVKLGVVTSDIPGSRTVAEKVLKPLAEKRGAEVHLSVVPVAVTDLSQVAREFKDAGVNAVVSYTLTHHILGTVEALDRIGWKGKFVTQSALPGILSQFSKLKSENFYGLDWYPDGEDGSEFSKTLSEAAKKYGANYPTNDVRWGWVSGIALAASLKACGWPCDAAKLTGEMAKVQLDNKEWLDLFGSPLKWTADNHSSPAKAFRVYRWNTTQNKLELVKDWMQVKEVGWVF